MNLFHRYEGKAHSNFEWPCGGMSLLLCEPATREAIVKQV